MTYPLGPGDFVPKIGFLQHRVGDRIKDRYTVTEHLGGGNFGSVYRVEDGAVGNVLACKEMHVLDNPDTPTNERALALDLFKREALNLATLRHPHIPAAYFDQEDGLWHICPVCGLHFDEGPFCPQHNATLLHINTRYYLMMDYVDGPTLEELALKHLRERGRPMEEEQCLRWTHEIASALRTLHRVGIIHRDVKPDNIKIRSGDDAAILLDFGLTKKVEEAGGYGTAPLTGTARFGTAGYAPENPRERERPEKRSDIHALGMTLYRLLSGRDPQDEGQLREMREATPRYFNRDISPETDRLILTATAPDLAMRHQSIDDFVTELEGILHPGGHGAGLPAFTFADGSKARNATELARMVDRHPEEARLYLFNGMLPAWLLQCGFAAPARTAEQAVKVYADNPARAMEVVRRSLFPTGTPHIMPQLEVLPATLNLGSVDSGSRIEKTLQLKNVGPGLLWGRLGIPARTVPGKSALASAVGNILAGGDGAQQPALPGLSVPTQFQGNDVSLKIELDTARVSTGSYSSQIIIETDAGTYNVPVSYSVVPLELEAEPAQLDFGTILVGRSAEAQLVVRPREATMGKPRGTIYVGPSLLGLSAPERFEGTEPIPVVLDAGSRDAVAGNYEGLMQLDTNGGRLRVPVKYRITLPLAVLMQLLLSAVVVGTGGAALVRLAYFLIRPEYGTRWLLDFGPGGATFAPYDFRGVGLLFAGGFLGMVGGWFYGMFLRRMPPPQRPGILKNSENNTLGTLPMIGLVVGAFTGYLSGSLLHYTLWTLGDWLLFPVADRLLPSGANMETAPEAWGALGAVLGLVWGLGRVFTATGKTFGRSFFLSVCGVLFLMLLLNAALYTAP